MNSFQIIEAIKSIKSAILQSRYLAAKMANKEQLNLYFAIGKFVSENTRVGKWGTGAIDQISSQLQQELPGLRGFSATNMRNMRMFAEAWDLYFVNRPSPLDEIHQPIDDELQIIKNQQIIIRQPMADELIMPTFEIYQPLAGEIENKTLNNFLSVGFALHTEIILKTKTLEERIFYIQKTATEFWSKEKLKYHLKEKLFEKQGNTLNNFEQTIKLSDLKSKALRAFKDEYLLDYINLEDPEDDDERVLETAIVNNIKKFIMSFGHDFCFMGNQFRIIINDKEVFIDLLFFHRSLNCLVAIELKRGDFKPEYSGKMNFYLSALDEYVKRETENSSIGIILCKGADEKFVQLSVKDISKPIGIATYKTLNDLPEEYKNVLPDFEKLKEIL